jgi:hypothetical protein
VSKTFVVPRAFVTNESTENNPTLMLDVEVTNGKVQDVRIQMPPELLDPDLVDLSEVLLRLPFDNKLVQEFSSLLGQNSEHISEDKRNFLVQCLDEMIGKFV